MKPITYHVPATTANLGPGFDSLGLALSIGNRVTVSDSKTFPDDPFLMGAAEAFFSAARVHRQPFSVKIKGDVPSSRGLGSSVTVRLGLLLGLNERFGKPLPHDRLLHLVVRLEGHPDNVAPAALGGFCACLPDRWLRTEVGEELYCIAAIPSVPMPTLEARRVLPRQVKRTEAVANVQGTAYITAAFFSQNYPALKSAFADHLHQPFRAQLLPGFDDALAAVEAIGALGGFLSGSGSTIMALALERPKSVARVLANSLRKAGHQDIRTLILHADNTGARRID
ncbi:MAG: homoserine kinase [Candidatus Methylacidiphilales bacterium]